MYSKVLERHSMDLNEYEDLYLQIETQVRKFLPQLRMPAKYISKKPTKDALVLTYLYKNLGKPVSKTKLTEIVRAYYPDVNDVQQGRHLATQKGFYIESGTRGDKSESLKPNEYKLVSLRFTYPGWTQRRSTSPANFDSLKALYGGRCATCGSKEGEQNFVNPAVVTKLERGHIDPRLDLTDENSIPQCRECNKAYRDWFIFDNRGRVRKINPASPRWIKIRDAEDDED